MREAERPGWSRKGKPQENIRGKRTQAEYVRAKQYVAIDLKSFYASVECMERGLDPLRANLVVADRSRTEKTICLAVSAGLKSFGISGRPRLFEVVQAVAAINEARRRRAPGHRLRGCSCDAAELEAHPEYAVDYYVAPPQMARYMQYSTRIYQIYLRYIAPEDIHVYSIDEVFMDLTPYLGTYRKSAYQLASEMVHAVLAETGITATVGLGTNLYLCKIAMDVLAKKMMPDRDGMRIAALDEAGYRRMMWEHTPITDFWRVGGGTARRLAKVGLHTMGDIARCSLGCAGEYYNEELLYKLFGVNAELLIDHAWGWEPCTMADIKAYRPAAATLGSGQVLTRPYSYEEARLVVREMTEQLALDLVAKHLVTDQLVLTIGYDIVNWTDPVLRQHCRNGFKTDIYGRRVPKHAHGTENLGAKTSSRARLCSAMGRLFSRIVNKALMVRRITLHAAHVTPEVSAAEKAMPEQLSMFTDAAICDAAREEDYAAEQKERNLQETELDIRRKFGKNALIKGMDLQEAATAIQRNGQIGGHKA